MDRIFDKYEIVRRVAYGGMGEVFLARQVGEARFDRLVILKSLRPELAQDEDLVEEFLEEARLAATLNHPNIVAIYEVGRSHGTYFIAMEYIRGEDVFRLCQASISQGRWVPLRVAVHIVRDAALGLDAAHTAQTPDGKPLRIVHRDVTPRNLMVRTDGVSKVVDFGVAKATDRAARTITGGLKGTIAYMSPEQAFAVAVDARSDQYSLGIILWEMLAKRRLFGGQDSIAVLEAVRSLEIRPPSAFNDAVPAELDTIVMRMLSREKEDRYSTCRAASDALSDYLGDFSGPAGIERVAAFVDSVAGDSIEARTADLTPSGVGLVPGSPTSSWTPTTRPVSSTTTRSSESRAFSVFWVVAIALALAGGLFLAQLDRVEEGNLEPLPPLAAGTQVEPASDRLPAPLPPPLSSPPPSSEGRLATGDPSAGDPSPGNSSGGDPSKEGSPPTEGAAPTKEDGVPEGASAREERGAEERGAEEAAAKNAAAAPTEGNPRLKDPAPAPRKPPSPKPRVARATPPAAPASGPTGNTQTAPVASSSSGDPATPGDRTAVVTLDTVPWTQVSIDATARGATPLYRQKLQPGRHILHLVNPEEGIDVWRTIYVKPGQVLHLSWNLRE